MRLIPLALLFLAFTLDAEARRAPVVPLAQTIVETWQNLSAWTVQTQQGCWQPSSSTVTATCQSSALFSTAQWEQAQPWSIEGQFSAQPHTLNRFWASLGWHVTEQSYATAVEVHGVAPLCCGGSYAGFLGATSGVWADIYGSYQAGSTRAWRVEWLPSKGETRVYLDGRRVGRYKVRPAGPLRARLECSSVPENTPADGSRARCVAGPLTVMGTPRV